MSSIVWWQDVYLQYIAQYCPLAVQAIFTTINHNYELIFCNYSKGLSTGLLYFSLSNCSSNFLSLLSGGETEGDSSQFLSLHSSCPSSWKLCLLCGTLWWRSGQVQRLTFGAGAGPRDRCECGAPNPAGPPGHGPSVGGVQRYSCAAQDPPPPPAPAVAPRGRSARPDLRCAPPVQPAEFEVHEPQPDRKTTRGQETERIWIWENEW